MAKKKPNDSLVPKFVFMNPYATFYVNNPEFKKYLAEMLNSEEWIVYDNDLTAIPTFFSSRGEFDNRYDEGSIVAGISISQFMSSMKGGISINPAVMGLMLDSKKWSNILNEVDQDALSISYIEIPYSFYKSFAKKEAVDEREFNSQSKNIKSVIQNCNKYINHTLH